MGGSAMAAIIQQLIARQANPNLQILEKYINPKTPPPDVSRFLPGTVQPPAIGGTRG